LWFSNGVAVDCNGRSGGLALWWHQEIMVEVRPWCQYFIDAKITLNNKSWRFSGIYGEPRTDLRGKTWEALRFLRRQDDLPWLCAGDFNEILFRAEQKGGNLRSARQMEDFSQCLTDCGLADLGYSGYDFTWDNKRDGADNIQVRLDRGMATSSFLDIFPLTQVEHIITEESDHMALLIRVQEELPRVRQMGQRGFQYEEMWIKHEGYEEMVKEAWLNGNNGDSSITGFWNRLHDVSRDMKQWSFDTFGYVRGEIKVLKIKLEEAKITAGTMGLMKLVVNLRQSCMRFMKGRRFCTNNDPDKSG
jgi:hypothetical protein